MDYSLLIGIAGFFSSIGFGLFSWFVYRESKKKERNYEYIHKLVELNINKDIDEEKINSLKGEISSLQEKIRQEIPKEARKTILKDRLNDAYVNLTNFYKDVQSISKELESLGETNEIPQNLLKDIEKEIQPKYLVKEKISFYQTLLTILTASAAISFALPFQPISWWIGIVFALFALLPIYKVIRNYNKLEIKFSVNKNFLPFIVLFLSIIGCFFCFTIVGIMLTILFVSNENDFTSIISSIIIGLLFLIISIYGVSQTIKSYRKYIDKT